MNAADFHFWESHKENWNKLGYLPNFNLPARESHKENWNTAGIVQSTSKPSWISQRELKQISHGSHAPAAASGISKRELKHTRDIVIEMSANQESHKENWNTASFSTYSSSKTGISQRELKQECFYALVCGLNAGISQRELKPIAGVHRGHRVGQNLTKRIETGRRRSACLWADRISQRELKRRLKCRTCFCRARESHKENWNCGSRKYTAPRSLPWISQRELKQDIFLLLR